MVERKHTGNDMINKALAGKVVLASSFGIDILRNNIKLTNDEIRRVTEEMRQSAILDPDLPENSQFNDLKIRLQFELPRKLADLKELEKKTVLFEERIPGKISFNTQFNARVEYSSIDVEEGRFILLGPIEASASNSLAGSDQIVISYLSPMGRALLGNDLKLGAKYAFSTPGGQAVCIIKHV